MIKKILLFISLIIFINSLCYAVSPYTVEFDTTTTPTRMITRVAGEYLIGNTTSSYTVKISSYECIFTGLTLDATVQHSLTCDDAEDSAQLNSQAASYYLTPSNMNAGTFDADVIISSVGAGVVGTNQIANDAIDNTKIGACTLDSDVIASSIAVNTVGTNQIINDAIDNTKIVGCTLDSDVIASSIAVNTVGADQVIDGSLTTDDVNFANQYLNTTSSPTFANTSITNGLDVDTDTLYVDYSNDRIGINTNTPDAGLHIETGNVIIGSTDIAQGAITINGSSADASIYINNTTGGGCRIYTNDSNGGLMFRSWAGNTDDTVDDLIISTGGFVGSGTNLIKWKTFSGTLDADNSTTVAHGLTRTKILSIDFCVANNPNAFIVKDNNSGLTGADDAYRMYADNTNVVWDGVGSNLQGAAYRIIIFYVE